MVSLAILLQTTLVVSKIEDAKDSARADTALPVLQAREALPDPQIRVGLAGSIVDPDITIPAANIEPEPGELIGLLLERGVIADDPTAFSENLMLDWPTREAALEYSEHFAEYMTPGLLPAEVLAKVFTSRRTPPRVKKKIIDNLADYAAGDDGAGIRAAAQYADQEGIALDHARLKLAVESHTADGILVRLIAHCSGLAEAELRDLLRGMDGDYPLLADPGTERRPIMPDDPAHRTILGWLKAAGVVSSYPEEGHGRLRVYRYQN